MIWIYSVHFWDIHISPQLRVSRAWQRLLGARAGVQDYSRKRQTNEARKGYNQTHNRLKLHFYFFSLSKTTLFIVILQKSTDVFSIASHSIPHPFSWNFTVCTTSAGLNCAPKINETRCITKKEIVCKTSGICGQSLSTWSYQHSSIQTCQTILSTRQRTEKKSKQNEY